MASGYARGYWFNVESRSSFRLERKTALVRKLIVPFDSFVWTWFRWCRLQFPDALAVHVQSLILRKGNLLYNSTRKHLENVPELALSRAFQITSQFSGRINYRHSSLLHINLSWIYNLQSSTIYYIYILHILLQSAAASTTTSLSVRRTWPPLCSPWHLPSAALRSSPTSSSSRRAALRWVFGGWCFCWRNRSWEITSTVSKSLKLGEKMREHAGFACFASFCYMLQKKLLYSEDSLPSQAFALSHKSWQIGINHSSAAFVSLYKTISTHRVFTWCQHHIWLPQPFGFAVETLVIGLLVALLQHGKALVLPLRTGLTFGGRWSLVAKKDNPQGLGRFFSPGRSIQLLGCLKESHFFWTSCFRIWFPGLTWLEDILWAAGGFCNFKGFLVPVESIDLVVGPSESSWYKSQCHPQNAVFLRHNNQQNPPDSSQQQQRQATNAPNAPHHVVPFWSSSS